MTVLALFTLSLVLTPTWAWINSESRMDSLSSINHGPIHTHRSLSCARWGRSTLQRRRRTTLLAAQSLSSSQLDELEKEQYVVIENFLSPFLVQSLRNDVQELRKKKKYFRTAKIGQDSTNTLNTDIRVAETCFFNDKLPAHSARKELLQILGDVAQCLPRTLDDRLSELLYAYYPQGGFYRKHTDSIQGSASVLREYSLLLYLNENWNEEKDKGGLRMYLPSGTTLDVTPQGGTLVLFDSAAIPHEVLDTDRERLAVVGWYNRPVRPGDVVALGGVEGGTQQLLLGATAAALVTVGVFQLVGSL